MIRRIIDGINKSLDVHFMQETNYKGVNETGSWPRHFLLHMVRSVCGTRLHMQLRLLINLPLRFIERATPRFDVSKSR
jgi:hypothetical protein